MDRTLQFLSKVLQDQGLEVREFALELGVPLKTAQDWVYRSKAPSAPNQARLTEYISTRCAHYWVIPPSSGPTSEGVCQRCGLQKEFVNSLDTGSPWSRSWAA